MDNNENRTEQLQPGGDRQIQLVLNQPEEDNAIDLGRVYLNMKKRRRLFSWVLLLCLAVGVSAMLLLYQFTKAPLKVSSIVTLRYEAPIEKDRQYILNGTKALSEATFEPVTDLTAPDGTALDVNQVTSAYVLQTALENANLAETVTAENVRANIGIQTVLTEESRRVKEALAGLVEVKNAEAYNQLQKAKMTYENRFVVTLQNGFGDEDSRVKTELTAAELKLLLNQILTAYNDYLVRMYADVRMPDDAFSVIDIEELDVLDSLDQMRAGIDDLYAYCNNKTDTVKAYRSWKTGRSLEEWMETLQTFRSINVDYLYAMVSETAITRDKTALLTGWKYMLRMAQNDLDKVNEDIAETQKILQSYKNDEVIISMQESDAAKTTKASTEYYNQLIMDQMANYAKAAELKESIADYTDRITRLNETKETEVSEAVEEELARSLSSVQALYGQIKSHMEELFESPMYTTYEDHSAAQGKEVNFLVGSMKKIIIGIVLGAIVAFGLWFLAGLAPEFARGKEGNRRGKEAAAK